MKSTFMHITESVGKELDRKFGRTLQLGEVVQEGDLLCSVPYSRWIPATSLGLIISDCDVGWYRRPAKTAPVPHAMRDGGAVKVELN